MVIGGWRILSATIPRHRHAFPPSSSIRPSRFYPLADDDTHYTLYCARPIAYLPQTATTSSTAARTCTHCSRSCTSTSDINPHTCIPHPSFRPSFVSLLVLRLCLDPKLLLDGGEATLDARELGHLRGQVGGGDGRLHDGEVGDGPVHLGKVGRLLHLLC